MFALVAMDLRMTSESGNPTCGTIIGSVQLIAFFKKAWGAQIWEAPDWLLKKSLVEFEERANFV